MAIASRSDTVLLENSLIPSIAFYGLSKGLLPCPILGIHKHAFLNITIIVRQSIGFLYQTSHLRSWKRSLCRLPYPQSMKDDVGISASQCLQSAWFISSTSLRVFFLGLCLSRPRCLSAVAHGLAFRATLRRRCQHKFRVLQDFT
jgi:hypothetical protein